MDTSPLLDVHFADFLPVCALSLNFLFSVVVFVCLFAEQILNLMESKLLFFMDCAFGSILEVVAKPSVTQIFLETTRFSYLSFRSMIHFELIFVQDVWSVCMQQR